MADEQVEEQETQPELPQEAAPEQPVSEPYRISLTRKGQFVRFEVWPDEYFFCVQAPLIGSDDSATGQTIDIVNPVFDEDNKPDLAKSTLRWTLSGQNFVAKCVAQVTDFCIPLTTDKGDAVVRTYDAKNGGDNRNNREVYEFLPDVPECQFRSILNGAMDYVAGDTTSARKDFDELLREQPRLLTTS